MSATQADRQIADVAGRRADDRRSTPPGDFFDGGARLGMELADHHRNPRLDDARFFSGDLAQRVAEKFLVIEIN